MKSMLRYVLDGDKRYPCLAFVCPGCAVAHDNSTGLHMLAVNTDQASPSWDWDGNLEAPTLSPSILTHHEQSDTDPRPTFRCHSFLKAGVFEFLDDCTHELAGQHVAMSDLPEWFVHVDEEKDD